MTYDEARAFLEKAAGYGSRPGLESISQLLKRLDNPQDKLRIIHIAGTNGKGSTAAFTASILACAGYKVGRFISPAVYDKRELIQLDHNCGDRVINSYITEEEIAQTLEPIKSTCEEMVRDGFSHPTVFEIETAMAFLYFFRQQVDFAIIETGMGGKLDATNVVAKPVCCLISSISMDHMQYLGDTLEEISRHKAGIIKKGVPVFTANTDSIITGVLKEACTSMDTCLTIVSAENAIIHKRSIEGTSFEYKGHSYTIRLLGEHQISNALLALEAAVNLKKQGYEISQQAIETGLQQARWRGRFEILAKKPYFIIDGAHNEDAARKLASAIMTYLNGKRLIFIMGIFADKEYKKVLEIMAPFADMIITITPPGNRALPSDVLAKEAANYFAGPIVDAGKVSAAVELAYKNADSLDAIIAFGSLSFHQELSVFLNGFLHLNQKS